MTEKLTTGDAFPALTLKLHDAGEIALPQQSEGGYQVVLFYRGKF